MHKSYCEIRKLGTQVSLETDNSDAELTKDNCRWKLIDKFYAINDLKDEQRYIYLIKCLEYTKIGITNNIKNRFESISTSTPFETEILFAIGVQNSEYHEKYLHQYFQDKHQKGEWFKLNQDDINWINDYLHTKSV